MDLADGSRITVIADSASVILTARAPIGATAVPVALTLAEAEALTKLLNAACAKVRGYNAKARA